VINWKLAEKHLNMVVLSVVSDQARIERIAELND